MLSQLVLKTVYEIIVLPVTIRVGFEEYPASEKDVINYVSTNLQHPIKSIDDIDAWNKQLEKDADDGLFDGVQYPFIYIDEIKVLV